MIGGAKIVDLRAIGKSNGAFGHQSHRTNRALSRDERVSEFGKIAAQSRDHTDAGDGDPPRHVALAAFAASNFSIPSTISRTERICRAASSGMSTSNSLSSANRMLI